VALAARILYKYGKAEASSMEGQAGGGGDIHVRARNFIDNAKQRYILSGEWIRKTEK
jgi:hypothetical protein